MTTSALAALHRPDRYPLASRFDPAWLVGLDMGPHPLWLLEQLLEHLRLEPGMRVLDLGAGRGATSVLLARELGVQVVTADLWVPPEEVARAAAEAGVADRVLALRAEAHALPFAAGSFDAVVCVDAFEYFGTSEHYLPHLTRVLVPGGRLGVATTALRTEPARLADVPAHVRACVGGEALAWHTAAWWEERWRAQPGLESVRAWEQEDGGRDWLLWQRAVASSPGGAGDDDAVLAMLEADGGAAVTFALLTARTPR